jgi:hypothetical protein
MKLQIGDWLTDDTGEYEVIGWPYTTASADRTGQPCWA